MTEVKERTLISFDWAMKSILRDKANFDVLEGFLSTLLERNIQVLSLLESEGNSRYADDKFNRVDLAVVDEHDEILLIEIQHDLDIDHLRRLLYGASKLITDHLDQYRLFSIAGKAGGLPLSWLHRILWLAHTPPLAPTRADTSGATAMDEK